MRRAAALGLLLLAVPATGRGQVDALGPGATASRSESSVSIRVVPDPVAPGDSLTVGDRHWFTVVPSGPSGYYLLPESVPEAYAERPEVAVVDRERRDGRLRLRLALFRPGDVTLPVVAARVVDDRGDTLRVPVVSDTVSVASVLAPGDTLLADIKPMWEPEGLPVWVWWVAGLLAAALLAAAVWWWRRRRKRARPAAAGPRGVADPYADARRRIDEAAGRTATPAERIAAAAEIGDALRDYLGGAWSVPARERTTFELLPILPGPLETVRPGLGGVFAQVDLAKFARVDPRPDGLATLARRAAGTLDAAEARRSPPTPEAERLEAGIAREAAS